MAVPRTAIPYKSSSAPRVDFRKGRFETLVVQKGYDVLWKRHILCPCRKTLTSQADSNCVNCHGTGYFHLVGQEIRALITNVMLQKNFVQQWSEILQGTVNITVESIYKIGWMDSVTVLNAESVYSEFQTVGVQPNGGAFFINTHYTPTLVLSAYRLVDVEAALAVIDVSKITIGEVGSRPALLISDDNLSDGSAISVLYEYHPEYLIIDILNDYRNTKIKLHEPVEQDVKMPLRAMMKRKHLLQ